MQPHHRRVNAKSGGFRGFVQIPWLVLRDRLLSWAAKVVFGGLSGILRTKPQRHISLRWLARWLGLDRATVQRAVAALEAGGHISVRDFGPGRVRHYVLTVPPIGWGNYVQVPRAILRADLPPLTRLVYAVALKRSGGKPRRMSCAGLARWMAAGRAAVALAWVRLVAAGWLTAQHLTRRLRRLWVTRHQEGWAKAKGRRQNRLLSTKNGLFSPVSKRCAFLRPPMRRNAATQETPPGNQKACGHIRGPGGPRGAPAPEVATLLERFQTAYRGPAGAPDSARDLIQEALDTQTPLDRLLAEAASTVSDLTLADWLFCRLFHVERS